MSGRSQRKARRQSRASRCGELQIGRATCGRCKAEFTFGRSEIHTEEDPFYMVSSDRKYVGCPRCSIRIFLNE